MNSGPGGTWYTTDDVWSRIDLPIVGWSLWYADGSVARGDWSAAPRVGVQALMLEHPGRLRTIVTGRDEYGLPGEVVTKLGLMIDIAEFDRIVARAMADV
jgi:hypothetical protein